MKGADLKAFRKANGLTQTQLGEFLGINKSFISTIESGKDPMPKEKLSKLIANSRGWDTTMLTSLVAPEVVGGVGRVKMDVSQLSKVDDGYVRRLKEELESVKTERDALLQEVAVLRYQLSHKGAVAENVGSSSCANVG